MTKFIVKVKSEGKFVWDEIEYGGNSTNSIDQLHLDLKYMIENPENLAGPIIEITVEESGQPERCPNHGAHTLPCPECKKWEGF